MNFLPVYIGYFQINFIDCNISFCFKSHWNLFPMFQLPSICVQIMTWFSDVYTCIRHWPRVYVSLSRLRDELNHYGDVIMGVLTSQITSLAIVYSTVHSRADQRKHQSSASLAFVREIHRWPVNFPHKWPVTRKMFPFDDVIMYGDIIVGDETDELWVSWNWSIVLSVATTNKYNDTNNYQQPQLPTASMGDADLGMEGY